MSFCPSSLENLIDQFASLPGIGKKSAQRLAFYVLAQPDEAAQSFADAIVDAIRAGDPRAARSAARRHLERRLKRARRIADTVADLPALTS